MKIVYGDYFFLSQFELLGLCFDLQFLGFKGGEEGISWYCFIIAHKEECEDLRQRVKDGQMKRLTTLYVEGKARVLHQDITCHTEVLKQLSSMGHLVVCAGGVQSLLRYGVSIWINVPLETLTAEVTESGDKGHSPSDEQCS
ncbi:hypothetical protein C5167_050517 [Papaver somniferum]|uniref:Uncharacterized protein n=1 Tax=Papaver somniferum TaxID=3469 RepID=A0A4Y7KT49_PAPSO|nr:hypothetical protein C5167_050517 [Papaver somniferum]